MPAGEVMSGDSAERVSVTVSEDPDRLNTVVESRDPDGRLALHGPGMILRS